MLATSRRLARRSLPFLVLVLGACASSQATRRSSSVVDYLAAATAAPVAGGAPAPQVPTLRLPLRVGVAFVPAGSSAGPAGETFTARDRVVLLEQVRAHFASRPFVGSIEVIPDAYLTARGGFEDLDKLRRMLGIDVVTLLSYDQVQFSDETRMSLTYLTIAGAYIVNGQKNDTRTMLDAAVFDIASRRMLFRAAGESHVRAGATAVTADRKRRDDARRGFREATDDMIVKLDAELERFAAAVRQPDANVTVVRPDSSARR